MWDPKHYFEVLRTTVPRSEPLSTDELRPDYICVFKLPFELREVAIPHLFHAPGCFRRVKNPVPLSAKIKSDCSTFTFAGKDGCTFMFWRILQRIKKAVPVEPSALPFIIALRSGDRPAVDSEWWDRDGFCKAFVLHVVPRVDKGSRPILNPQQQLRLGNGTVSPVIQPALPTVQPGGKIVLSSQRVSQLFHLAQMLSSEDVQANVLSAAAEVNGKSDLDDHQKAQVAATVSQVISMVKMHAEGIRTGVPAGSSVVNQSGEPPSSVTHQTVCPGTQMASSALSSSPPVPEPVSEESMMVDSPSRSSNDIRPNCPTASPVPSLPFSASARFQLPETHTQAQSLPPNCPPIKNVPSRRTTMSAPAVPVSSSICRAGHELQLTLGPKTPLGEQYPANDYVCDGCQLLFHAGTTPCLHCQPCGEDYCPTCAAKMHADHASKQQHQHHQQQQQQQQQQHPVFSGVVPISFSPGQQMAPPPPRGGRRRLSSAPTVPYPSKPFPSDVPYQQHHGGALRKVVQRRLKDILEFLPLLLGSSKTPKAYDVVACHLMENYTGHRCPNLDTIIASLAPAVLGEIQRVPAADASEAICTLFITTHCLYHCNRHPVARYLERQVLPLLPAMLASVRQHHSQATVPSLARSSSSLSPTACLVRANTHAAAAAARDYSKCCWGVGLLFLAVNSITWGSGATSACNSLRVAVEMLSADRSPVTAANSDSSEPVLPVQPTNHEVDAVLAYVLVFHLIGSYLSSDIPTMRGCVHKLQALSHSSRQLMHQNHSKQPIGVKWQVHAGAVSSFFAAVGVVMTIVGQACLWMPPAGPPHMNPAPNVHLPHRGAADVRTNPRITATAKAAGQTIARLVQSWPQQQPQRSMPHMGVDVPGWDHGDSGGMDDMLLLAIASLCAASWVSSDTDASLESFWRVLQQCRRHHHTATMTMFAQHHGMMMPPISPASTMVMPVPLMVATSLVLGVQGQRLASLMEQDVGVQTQLDDVQELLQTVQYCCPPWASTMIMRQLASVAQHFQRVQLQLSDSLTSPPVWGDAPGAWGFPPSYDYAALPPHPEFPFPADGVPPPPIPLSGVEPPSSCPRHPPCSPYPPFSPHPPPPPHPLHSLPVPSPRMLP